MQASFLPPPPIIERIDMSEIYKGKCRVCGSTDEQRNVFYSLQNEGERIDMSLIPQHEEHLHEDKPMTHSLVDEVKAIHNQFTGMGSDEDLMWQEIIDKVLASQWRKVEDGLPDIHDRVLVLLFEESEPAIDHVTERNFPTADGKTITYKVWATSKKQVTHWTSIPEITNDR